MGLAFYIGVCIIAAPFLLLTLPGCWRLFEKAGRPGWEALIPVYATYVKLKICGRPSWWLICFIVPVVNLIIGLGIQIEFVKSYGKLKLWQQIAAMLLPFIFLNKWGFDNTTYSGPLAGPDFKLKFGKAAKMPAFLSWGVAFLCVVVLAAFLRAFFIGSYMIPTPAMERTLLVGDYIFVNKLTYGARIPITISPYFRLPGFGDVKRGDVLVFNYPMDADSPLYRPVDKRENFIKRCQGIAGDTLSVVDGQVYINDKATPVPPESEMEYSYETNGADLNPQVISDLKMTLYEGHTYYSMTKQSADALKEYSNIKNFKAVLSQKGSSESVYPVNAIHPVGPQSLMLTGRQPDYKWSVDNYGPIIIPKKGWTVKLDSLTYPIYERCINVYENNKLEVNGSDIYINGKKADSYTFKMNYYWMMGDNRHDSDDSRYWGFVPEDHIIGKAFMIWVSEDVSHLLFGRIRWDRLFKAIN